MNGAGRQRRRTLVLLLALASCEPGLKREPGVATVNGPPGADGGAAQDAAAPDAALDRPAGFAPACDPAGAAGLGHRWIAFDSDRGGFGLRQLYAMHPDGSGVVRLLESAYNDREPAYSPDGKSLAFISDRAGVADVFVLDLATRQVTKLSNLGDGAEHPTFSHDGTTIAYGGRLGGGFLGGLDGTGLRLFTDNGHRPQFSADDTELLFDDESGIQARNRDTGEIRQIVSPAIANVEAPAVSPEGRDVAYHARCKDEPGTSLWTTPFSIATEACQGRRITPPGQLGGERPAWGSPSVLAYQQVDGTTQAASVAVISRALGSAPCTITPPGEDSRNPAWAPDPATDGRPDGGLDRPPATDGPGCSCPSPYPGPNEPVRLPLACYCAGHTCPATLDAYLSGGCTGPFGRSRETGCGKVAFSSGGGYGGSQVTFDARTGQLIGIRAGSDTPWGNCDAFDYFYGDPLLGKGAFGSTSGGCEDITSCTVCGTPRPGAPLCP
jgi:hypothetical protein